MNQEMNTIAARYDAEEARCVSLQTKLENARTPFGRAIAQVRLQRHRAELQQLTDEYDVADLYHLMAAQPATEAAVDSPEQLL